MNHQAVCYPRNFQVGLSGIAIELNLLIVIERLETRCSTTKVARVPLLLVIAALIHPKDWQISDRSMGRTIPSFRIAAEMEAVKWRDFRLALNRKDRRLFDRMLS
jgi:hypothetical protein